MADSSGANNMPARYISPIVVSHDSLSGYIRFAIHTTSMSTLSSFLRIIVVVVGFFLVVASVKSGQWLFALGLACFFGFAFSALSFSGIDPSATDRSSGRWFLVAAGFGVVGFVAVASLFVLSLIDGNSKNAIRTGGGLLLVVSVCWNKRAELAAAIKRNLNSLSASDEPGQRPRSPD